MKFHTGSSGLKRRGTIQCIRTFKQAFSHPDDIYFSEAFAYFTVLNFHQLKHLTNRETRNTTKTRDCWAAGVVYKTRTGQHSFSKSSRWSLLFPDWMLIQQNQTEPFAFALTNTLLVWEQAVFFCCLFGFFFVTLSWNAFAVVQSFNIFSPWDLNIEWSWWYLTSLVWFLSWFFFFTFLENLSFVLPPHGSNGTFHIRDNICHLKPNKDSSFVCQQLRKLPKRSRPMRRWETSCRGRPSQYVLTA